MKKKKYTKKEIYKAFGVTKKIRKLIKPLTKQQEEYLQSMGVNI